MTPTYRVCWGVVLSMVLLNSEATLSAHIDEVDVSYELTLFYRSARAVISRHQPHINNKHIADKGITGLAVLNESLKLYKLATGSVLDQASATHAQKALFAAVVSVVDEAQVIMNEQGKGFKGFLPVVFARQVAKKFNVAMLGKMKIKITAPKEYVRNALNSPDAWESHIIESQFKKGNYEKGRPFFEQVQYKNQSVFRYILPEYYGPSCLVCHGEPKGALDITGGRKEGGKVNELGGAVSLMIFKEQVDCCWCELLVCWGGLIDIVASVCRLDPVNTRDKAAIDINRVQATHRLKFQHWCAEWSLF